MPNLPPTFKPWTEGMEARSVRDIRDLYERGFQGAFKDEEATEELLDALPYKSFGAVADEFGLWNTDAPDLCLPFLNVVKLEADRLGIAGDLATLSRNPHVNPWPEKQTTGDCVSHWIRNHVDLQRAAEIVTFAEPESWRVRTATEPSYGARGHSGEGANCSRLLQFVMQAGSMLRQKYDVTGFGVLDLSVYNARIGMNWGGRGVPDAVRKVCAEHPVKTGTQVTTVEEAVAVFKSGRTTGGCSSFGFSGTRNEDGVAENTTSWAHAMVHGGMDARPDTVSKYGGRLFLIINSWGAWNRGPRQIRGTNVYIPEGSFWVRERTFASMLRGGGMFTLSGVDGWPALKLPDLGATGRI